MPDTARLNRRMTALLVSPDGPASKVQPDLHSNTQSAISTRPFEPIHRATRHRFGAYPAPSRARKLPDSLPFGRARTAIAVFSGIFLGLRQPLDGTGQWRRPLRSVARWALNRGVMTSPDQHYLSLLALRSVTNEH